MSNPNTFFQTLMPLLQQCHALTITLTAVGDQITVITNPLVKPGATTMFTPLQLTGTPAEMDEGFAEAIGVCSVSVKSMKDQLAQVEAQQAADLERLKSKPAKKGASSKIDNDDDDNDDDEKDDDISKPVVESTSVSAGSTSENSSSVASLNDELFA